MPGFTTRPELRGDFGMVASTHWLASATGMSVLERGGNAFDAAVAAGFTLQVVEPHLNGPGGEVPVLFQARGGAPRVLCGQGVSPAAATIGAFSGMDRIPGSGVLAATVPGSFDAWMLLLRDHGTMTVRQVLDHAIGLAERGYPVLDRIAAAVEALAPVFSRHWAGSAALYLPHGTAPAAGSRLRNPALAATYRRIVSEAETVGSDRETQIEAARRSWSQGFVAEAVGAFLSSPVPNGLGEPQQALLTAQDMADWSATYEDPVSVTHGAHTVHKTGPWGQGPAMLQQLRTAEVLGIGSDVREGVSADFVHRVTEAAKLAFADREAWYGDPDFTDVPLKELLSARYAAERSRLVDDARACLDLRPGSPGGRAPFEPPSYLPGDAPGDRTTGEPTVRNAAGSGQADLRGDTCHLDVVDADGNMVSATPSGGWLSSSPVIPELGFPLGTRAQMFWLDPASPNALSPRRRPRTTLSPTLVCREDGEAVLAIGTPGGDQQDQWTTTALLRVLNGVDNLQEALDTPMFHTNAFPSSFHPRETVPGDLVVEPRVGRDVIAELSRRGHRVQVAQDWSLGRLAAVARDPESGELRSAADARGNQNYASGR
ncbi:gamma-glutamyltransferase [Nocardiopsis terrae]|uniref:Gamma-glutamyltranspeptidase/glutathione hydrolase n=1 Tax=Nocardiopsis terrae TaxID=372655 RepID=A0ABR9HKC6_9ACTN|nr:gamma-glutamyltransferase family protein [Nocardiopsis terrae]MBE1459467.1 gamma-glutamyltranspeptidase/glutathione hydrolase [Nocardiopsis terrae]GHC95487.1 gamma-glutamyltransferase [Nocardiopsis terrae]